MFINQDDKKAKMVALNIFFPVSSQIFSNQKSGRFDLITFQLLQNLTKCYILQ